MEENFRYLTSAIAGFLLLGQAGFVEALITERRLRFRGRFWLFVLSYGMGYGALCILVFDSVLDDALATVCGICGYAFFRWGVAFEVLLPSKPVVSNGGLRQRLYLRAPWLFREW